jgi:hypothetical protein
MEKRNGNWKMENGKWVENRPKTRKAPKGSKKGPERRPECCPRAQFSFVFPKNKHRHSLLPIHLDPWKSLSHRTRYLMALCTTLGPRVIETILRPRCTSQGIGESHFVIGLWSEIPLSTFPPLLRPVQAILPNLDPDRTAMTSLKPAYLGCRRGKIK